MDRYLLFNNRELCHSAPSIVILGITSARDRVPGCEAMSEARAVCQDEAARVLWF